MQAAERAEKAGVIQFGFQQRFSPEYLRAQEIWKAGKIGKSTLMESYWILGNAPARSLQSPYPPQEQKIRHWGAWMDHSGGPIVEQDCHTAWTS
jgi:predicted dehydrogenase